MNYMNPVLTGATQTANLQANGLTDTTANEPKVTDKTNTTTSTGGNTTVTLTDKNQVPKNDYLELSAKQRVNEKNSLDSENTESSETTNGLTYASNLQSQASYNVLQATPSNVKP